MEGGEADFHVTTAIVRWVYRMDIILLFLRINVEHRTVPPISKYKIASMSGFPRVSANSSSPFGISSVAVRLTGELTSLEEPTDDPDIVILSALLADRPNFVGFERRVEPEGPT
jgi:hypothetical protein